MRFWFATALQPFIMALMGMNSKRPDIQLEPADYPALAMLGPDEIREFRASAQPLDLAADVAVISEGQHPRFLYLVHSGLLRVIKRHGNKVFEVGAITPGNIFGEAGILYDAPAGAEVRSAGACSLFRIPLGTVRKVLESNPRFRRGLGQLAEKRQAATAVAVNPVFSKLPREVRETLLYNARFITLAAGETLFEEGGTNTRAMFLVLAGRAEASMRHPRDPSRRIIVARISAGDEVGEISIITGKPHATTVTALTPLRLMVINNKAVHAWRGRYSDFGYSLYACAQRKLQHSLEALRKVVDENEARARTVDTLPPINKAVPGTERDSEG